MASSARFSESCNFPIRGPIHPHHHAYVKVALNFQGVSYIFLGSPINYSFTDVRKIRRSRAWRWPMWLITALTLLVITMSEELRVPLTHWFYI